MQDACKQTAALCGELYVVERHRQAVVHRRCPCDSEAGVGGKVVKTAWSQHLVRHIRARAQPRNRRAVAPAESVARTQPDRP
eukprot:6156277-Pleurochrysis_carterae.AAC.1